MTKELEQKFQSALGLNFSKEKGSSYSGAGVAMDALEKRHRALGKVLSKALSNSFVSTSIARKAFGLEKIEPLTEEEVYQKRLENKPW